MGWRMARLLTPSTPSSRSTAVDGTPNFAHYPPGGFQPWDFLRRFEPLMAKPTSPGALDDSAPKGREADCIWHEKIDAMGRRSRARALNELAGGSCWWLVG